MADVFDQAQDRAQQDLEQCLQAARAAVAPKLKATGECRNPLCGEPLEAGRLFCGPACAQEHARRVK